MLKRLAIGLGAGLAAGILFVVPTKGTLAATFLAVAAPLPIMIATMGFGQWVGLGAAAVGVAIITALVNPLFAAIFAVSVGLPSWFLSLVALRRPAGSVLAWAAGISAALALAFMALAAARFGSYQIAADTAADRLAPNLEAIIKGDLPGGFSARDFAGWMVLIMPAVMAAWGVGTLAVNLWTAGRVVQVSALLPIAWPDLHDTLRLPKLAAFILVLAIAGCALPGPARVGAGAIAAAIALAFAFQGFGAIHAMTRGRPGRPAILAGIYVLTFALMPWPLVLVSFLGVADCLATLPRRANPTNPQSKTKGDKIWK